MINILLTSVGRRGYLVEYFKEALRGIGELHASNSEYTYPLDLADSYVITPLIYDKQYIPALLEYSKKHKINAIISLFDADLLVLAKHRELFARNGTKIILASKRSVEICNDKWKTFLFLKKLKIKTPETFLNINAVKKFPVVVKPRWGAGSIGVYFAENESELEVLYKKSRYEVFNSYLKYESAFAPNEAVLIQEILTGQEYGLDVLNDLRGNYVKTFAKKKLAMRAGETDIGETVGGAKFESIGKKLSEYIKHEGLLSVDCFVVDDEIFVTELNCRISGHYPVSYLAGFNLPKQIVKWLNGEPTDEKLLRFKEGVFVVKDLVPRLMSLK